MALNDYKILSTDTASYGVQAAPNKLTGTAQQNKAVFDQFIDNKLMTLYNSLINALQAVTAAGELGYDDTITELNVSKVQTAIAALKVLIDACSPSSVTNSHFKDVSINESTGVFTFTREDGTTKTVDTALEKVVTNWTYDAATQSLVLTLKDGSTVSISLSSFITETEFLDSVTIDFDVNNHKVTASIKNGSVTDAMLDSDLLTAMQGYVASCSDSAATATTKATEATNSATAALGAKNDAVTAKNDAVNAKDTAVGSATVATTGATTSTTNALVSEGFAVGKQNGVDVTSGSPYYHNNSKYFKEQAAAIVSADMNKSVYDTHLKETDIFDYADSAVATHEAKTNNPHSVTLEQVAGSGYVNNIAMVVTFSDNTTATYNLVGKSV